MAAVLEQSNRVESAVQQSGCTADAKRNGCGRFFCDNPIVTTSSCCYFLGGVSLWNCVFSHALHPKQVYLSKWQQVLNQCLFWFKVARQITSLMRHYRMGIMVCIPSLLPSYLIFHCGTEQGDRALVMENAGPG